MNKITVSVAAVVVLFMTYSLGYRLGSKRSSDECREISRDLIEKILTENGCAITTKSREFEKYPTTTTITNCTISCDSDKFDYWVYLAQHSKYQIVRTISMLVPDLYYRTISSVWVNGETYNKLNLNGNFNSVTNISIVSGSNTCLVYRRPRLLKDYNKHTSRVYCRLCRRYCIIDEIAAILPDICDRSINTVRIDNVLLGDFKLSTEFKSINHIEVIEDGNWVTVYKRPDTIILHHQ